MGAFVSMGLADVVSIGQQWHQIRKDEAWSRRGHALGVQSMRIDMINTVREEVRDQVAMIVSSLDNHMVVATLMLTIGFGFVVEGTFPPVEKDYEYDDTTRPFLVIYSILCAFSLVCPLASLMLTIAARFEVELCQQRAMGDLQKHLLQALPEPGRTDLDLASEDDPWSPRRTRSRSNSEFNELNSPGNQRRPSFRARDVVNGLARSITGPLIEDSVEHILKQDVRRVAEGILQKVSYYQTLYPIAQIFLWCGIIAAVLTCSILLGLYYMVNFPLTPWMWRLYSGTTLICAIFSLVFLVWMKSVMLRDKHRLLKDDDGPPRLSQQSVSTAESSAPHVSQQLPTPAGQSDLLRRRARSASPSLSSLRSPLLPVVYSPTGGASTCDSSRSRADQARPLWLKQSSTGSYDSGFESAQEERQEEHIVPNANAVPEPRLSGCSARRNSSQSSTG